MAAAAAKPDAMVEALNDIVKARNDDREYRRIVLKNSLEVLLISDPDTDKCAASMNVRIGHFCNPPGIEGLAHFLEHMLFFSSEKYPLGDSFQKFITEHGGRSNAYTSLEDTNYHFDVNVDSFEEALDRFAQFFIKPLLSEDAVGREINAVDSENEKNLHSDSWRLDQLNRHLSKDSHPYHKFGTGNKHSLEFSPKENGINIRDELIKFYEEHYSANLMNLVAYGKDPLDKLQALVEEKFQDIRNTGHSCFGFLDMPLSSEHLQILVRAVPICDDHTLKIEWQLTSTFGHYKEIPDDYLSHVIGHEGEGSLFHILKKLGWATGLFPGVNSSELGFNLFQVSIDLTDAGQEHMEDIVGLLFKYIDLIKSSGICKWIFDELAAVSEMEFHYQDRIPPLGYVIDIASNMNIFPIQDWLVKDSMPSTYNQDLIRSLLDELSPKNCRIFWVSKEFDGITDLVEPWYGTAYSVERFTETSIEKWIETAPDEKLHLPVPNPFIASDISLKTVEKEFDQMEFPVLLRKSPYSSLWYKPDTKFSVPKASVKIRFRCPYACCSPEALVLVNILTSLVTDYLNEWAFYAEEAGLEYYIGSTSSGFEISVEGYNDKLRILLENVLEKVAKFEVKPDRFYVIKERMIKNYQNIKFDEPYRQALFYSLLLLIEPCWPRNERLEILLQLEPKDPSKFIPIMLSRAFLDCYIAGNVERKEAESIVQQVEDVFFAGPNPICKKMLPSQYPAERIVKLEEGMSYIYSTEGLNPDNKSSTLVHYIQIRQDEYAACEKLRLLCMIAEQEAFHQLRTVEQLGYIADLRERYLCGISGLQFIIQSTSKDPKQIELSIENFLRQFEIKLYEMTDDEFQNHVNELIEVKLKKCTNLFGEVFLHWLEISEGTFKFDRVESEVSILKKLTKQDLVNFFDEHLKVGAPKKRTLSIRVYGSSHASEYEQERSAPLGPNSKKIDDILNFKRSQSLYGCPVDGYNLMMSCQSETKGCSK